MTKVISVNEMSKAYNLKETGTKSLKEMFKLKPSKKQSEAHAVFNEATNENKFWALRDITFDIEQGDRVAIIGGNGAGKSTLLKIISRITEPTEGSVLVNGHVSSLLEVGTGFHPELSGRENIYLNGSILGMKRREIQSKFDSIVQFSGVEKFIDTPVKYYSSGMYVRLAFSVSAWLDPKILIVDEVLSVGDQFFQKRCAQRINELTRNGTTLLLVSHSMETVKSMCQKALYLKNGKLESFGSIETTTNEYIFSGLGNGMEVWGRPYFDLSTNIELSFFKDTDEYIEFINCSILNSRGNVSSEIEIENQFSVHLTYQIKKEIPYKVVPNFHFYDHVGERFFVSFPDQLPSSIEGVYKVSCVIDPFQFNNGKFSVMVAVSSYEMKSPLHFAIENALRFEIIENPGVDPRRHGWERAIPGVSRMRLKWNLLQE